MGFKKLMMKLSNGEMFISTNIFDIKYLFNVNVSKGIALITKDKPYLGVDSRYKFSLNDVEIFNYSSLPKAHTNKNLILSPNGQYCEIKNILDSLNTENIQYIDLVSDLRMTKSEEDIENVKKAALICKKTIKWLSKKVKKGDFIGVSEIDVEKLLKINMLKNGAEGFSFNPIIAFGENSAIPHHSPSKKVYVKNDVILCDFGVIYGGMCVDVTRTFVFNETQETFYDAVQYVKNMSEKKVQKEKDLSYGDLSKFSEQCFKDLSINGSIIHSLGHGIGLEVHEKPSISHSSKEIISNNHLFTIEPGIYIDNAFGIRLEDTYLYSNNRLINLTK